MIHHRLDENYSPLYFLAALGAGGTAIAFYIYLMFMVEHPDLPVVTIDQLWPLMRAGNPVDGAFAGLAMLALLSFSLLHFRLLIWNLLEFRRFRRTEAYPRLRNSGAETSLLAIPLTLAMSVNVSFVTAAVLIPDLWRYIESLFPVALLTLSGIGAHALFLYARFVNRVVRGGTAAELANHGLGQMMAAFAFAMVAVGLAAPGCMSELAFTSSVGTTGALFFAAVAAVLGLVTLTFGLRRALHHGLAPAASPCLWIAIPVLSLLGIVAIRLQLGPLQGFDKALLQPGLFSLTAVILTLQVLFGVLGYFVMQRLGYFRDYLHGRERHPGSYALICPGIALFVFGMYFVTFGLVKNGLLDRDSLAYYVVLAPLVFIQIKTAATMLRLNRRLLGSPLAI